MFIFECQIRVRYAETDQMGFVYYGHYATYFEVARVEALRSIGLSYKELEKSGLLMPVIENHSKYLRPARYDDLLTIRLYIKELPGLKIKFNYEVYNQEKVLLNLGETVLVFVGKESGKIEFAPEQILSVLKPYFETVQ